MKPARLLLIGSLLVSGLWSLPSTQAQTPQFEALNLPPGYDPLPDNFTFEGTTRINLSSDRSTVAATVQKSVGGVYQGLRAVRWNVDGTPQELPPLGTNADGLGNCRVKALSSDGTIVLGESDLYANGVNLGSRAVRWNAAGDIFALPDLGSTDASGNATINGTSLSADGMIAGGFGETYASDGTYSGTRASLWNDDGTVEVLPTLGIDNTGRAFAELTHLSSDGSLAVGTSQKIVNGEFLGGRVVRWNVDGIHELESLTSSGFGGNVLVRTAQPRAISSDGTLVVGVAEGSVSNSYRPSAVRWDAAGAISELASSAGNVLFINPSTEAVSADGLTVIGFATLEQNQSVTHAVRWNAQGQLVDLGTIGNVAGSSFARDVSAAGTVAAGSSATTLPGGEACLWFDTTPRSLHDLFTEDYHVPLTGWTNLKSASRISADASVVVGYGLRDGIVTVFRGTLGSTTSTPPRNIADSRPLAPYLEYYVREAYNQISQSYTDFPWNGYFILAFHSTVYAYYYDNAANQVTALNEGELAAKLAEYARLRYQQAVWSYYAYDYSLRGASFAFNDAVFLAIVINANLVDHAIEDVTVK